MAEQNAQSSQSRGEARRKKIARYYVNALRMKMDGTITNEEFQRRINRNPDEQLALIEEEPKNG
jgi:hypothetical protein